MRWKAKKEWKEGDVRTVRRFAILPKKTTDDYVIWLESYWAVEVYHYIPGMGCGEWYIRTITIDRPGTV